MLTSSTLLRILMLTMITLRRKQGMWNRLWKASPPLTATGMMMIAVLAGTLIGLAVDPRTITGAPAWLKPAKFAASIAIYTLTLAWIFSLIPQFARTCRVVGWTTAVTLTL